MKVTGFRILIKPDDIEKVSDGGIVLVEDERVQRADIDTGIVLDVGSTAWKKIDDGNQWCKPGDYVLYSKYGHKTIIDPESDKRNPVYLCVVNDEDILFVIKTKEQLEEEKTNGQ